MEPSKLYDIISENSSKKLKKIYKNATNEFKHDIRFMIIVMNKEELLEKINANDVVHVYMEISIYRVYTMNKIFGDITDYDMVKNFCLNNDVNIYAIWALFYYYYDENCDNSTKLLSFIVEYACKVNYDCDMLYNDIMSCINKNNTSRKSQIFLIKKYFELLHNLLQNSEYDENYCTLIQKFYNFFNDDKKMGEQFIIDNIEVIHNMDFRTILLEDKYKLSTEMLHELMYILLSVKTPTDELIRNVVFVIMGSNNNDSIPYELFPKLCKNTKFLSLLFDFPRFEDTQHDKIFYNDICNIVACYSNDDVDSLEYLIELGYYYDKNTIILAKQNDNKKCAKLLKNKL
jgi:hypothetical protein